MARKRMFCSILKICGQGEAFLDHTDKKFYQLRHAIERLSETTIKKHRASFEERLEDFMRHVAACPICDIEFYDNTAKHIDDLFSNNHTYQEPITRQWGTSYERCDEGIVYVYAIDYSRGLALQHRKSPVSETEYFHRQRFYNIVISFKRHVSSCKTCRARFIDDYIESLIPQDKIQEYRLFI